MKRRQFLGSVAAAALFLGMTGGVAFADTPADTLVIAKVIDDAISFDPAESYEDTGTEVLRNVYEPLVGNDATDMSKLTGLVAESWTFSDDNKTATFKLRAGQTFASGNPLTANDVVYSFARVVKAGKSPAFILKQFGWTAENVDSMIKAVDDQTFEMKITVDYAPSLVLNILSSVNASVVDSVAVKANEKDGDFGRLSQGQVRRLRPVHPQDLEAEPDHRDAGQRGLSPG